MSSIAGGRTPSFTGSGGIKLLGCRGTLVRNNHVGAHPGRRCLWLDFGNQNSRVHGKCDARYHHRAGRPFSSKHHRRREPGDHNFPLEYQWERACAWRIPATPSSRTTSSTRFRGAGGGQGGTDRSLAGANLLPRATKLSTTSGVDQGKPIFFEDAGNVADTTSSVHPGCRTA